MLTTEEAVDYVNPKDHIRYFGPSKLNPAYGLYYANGYEIFGLLTPSVEILALLPDGIRIVPVPNVGPPLSLESETDSVVDKAHVLSKRRVMFANELHKRIETNTKIKDLKGLVLNAFEPTEVVKVEQKKKPKFDFMRKVLRKLRFREPDKLKGTVGLKSILKTSEQTEELEDKTGLKRCKSRIILDNPMLEANEERPKYFNA